MKYLIIQNKKNRWLENLNLDQDYIKIDVDLTNHDFKSLLSKTLNELNENNNDINVVLIPLIFDNRNPLDKVCLELIYMIRFGYKRSNIYNLPIIILTPFKLGLQSYLFPELNRIFVKGGMHLIEYGDEIDSTKYKKLSPEQYRDWLDDIKNFLEVPEEFGRHSLANEWSLLKLSSFLSINEITEHEFNNGEFYNPYLQRELARLNFDFNKKQKNISEINSFSTQPTNFLLIDDKVTLGWDKVISSIIKKLNNENQLYNFDPSKLDENNRDKMKSEIEHKISKNKIELIFLDLRLFDAEENKTLEDIDSIENFSGAYVLKKIKEKFPWISVIIITASQQAFNSKRLYDIGADYYFIKESPLNNLSYSIFIKEIEKLFKQIRILSKKSKDLYYYHTKIGNIKKNLNNVRINKNIKKRIKKKLDLAFGLLRTRRSDYDLKFPYKDHDLAFLTMWSILNEFECGWFDKSRINNISLITRNKYIIKDNKSIIDEGEYDFSNIPQKFKKKLNKKSEKHFPFYDGNMSIDLSEKHKDKVKFYYELNFLVAGFIYITFEDDIVTAKDTIFLFYVLKQIRNKLDFTHPKENIIKTKPLVSSDSIAEAKQNCKWMIDFLEKILIN